MSKLNRRYIRWAAQLVALVLLTWGITHAFRKASDQLTHQQSELHRQADELKQQAESADEPQRSELLQQADRIQDKARTLWHASPVWLLLSSVCYAIGMIPAGHFWRRCLLQLDQPAPAMRTLYAYILGHLGKYFPGKAMVLVLRVGVLAPLGVLKIATTLTIFMETLTMMAVGSALAVISLWLLDLDWRWTLLAIGLTLVTFVPTLPPILQQVLKRTQKNVEPELMAKWLRRMDWTLIGQGWISLCVTWVFYGLSLACILRALPVSDFASSSLTTILLSSLGASAMAVVLGFVSFLPGGVGVREVVLSTMLGPIVGPVAALASAVWLRIVWLATEIVMAIILRFMTQKSVVAQEHIASTPWKNMKDA